MSISIATNEDNMLMMSRYPDKFFDVGIVDPEYGIDAGNMTMGSGKNKKYIKKDWDKKAANKEYFDELFRVTKNQIVWGGNYFANILPVTKNWIVWDKLLNKDISFSDCELAWTSFNCNIKITRIQYSGFLGADEIRIHNTQKPKLLYNWIIKRFCNKGDLILDTHLGSGSSRIVAYELGYDFYATEIDKDEFEKQENRFLEHKKNNIFTPQQLHSEQIKLL